MNLIILDIVTAFRSRGWNLYKFSGEVYSLRDLENVLSLGPVNELIPGEKYIPFPCIEENTNGALVIKASQDALKRRRAPIITLMEQDEKGNWTAKGAGIIDNVMITEDGLLITPDPRMSEIDSIIVPFVNAGHFITKFLMKAYRDEKSNTNKRPM